VDELMSSRRSQVKKSGVILANGSQLIKKVFSRINREENGQHRFLRTCVFSCKCRLPLEGQLFRHNIAKEG